MTDIRREISPAATSREVQMIGPNNAQSKLQENSAKGLPSVLVGGAENQGVTEFQYGDRDCSPPYIVSDVSTPPSHKPIPFHTAENVIQASGFAYALGFPLEYLLTVHWREDEGIAHALLLRKIAEWQRYYLGHSIFVWAREIKGGPHSHILLYIPCGLARQFRKMVCRWLKELFGAQRLTSGTVSVTKIRSHGKPYEHIRNRVRYILKGADEATCLFLGRSEKRERGIVKGKRAGVSQALGQDARRRADSVLPSGHRNATGEMLEAALVRDREKKKERDRYLRIGEKT